jgi:hypothetical protein
MALEVAQGILRVARGAVPAGELSFRPRALVLWWCREQSAGCAGGIGFATDGAGGASTAWAADDMLAPGVFNRRAADSPLLLHGDPRNPAAADHGDVRFAEHGFSVEWEQEPEEAWLVHYLALGDSEGSELPRAAVRSLLLDAPGQRVVSGIGFTPDVVLAALGGSLPGDEPQAGLAVGFGAAARLGGQVASGFASVVDSGGTIARGALCTEGLAVLPAPEPGGEIAAFTRVLSFDPDGFTLESTRLNAPLPLALLVLEGNSFTVGLGSASTRTTNVGFRPDGALLFGTGLDAMSRARDIGRLSLGGFSRNGGAGCVSWSTRRRGASPPEPRSRSSAEAVFDVVNSAAGGLHAQAKLAALRRRGFLLSWPVRDRAPRDFGWVAFGSGLREQRLRDRLRLPGRGDSLHE